MLRLTRTRLCPTSFPGPFPWLGGGSPPSQGKGPGNEVGLCQEFSSGNDKNSAGWWNKKQIKEWRTLEFLKKKEDMCAYMFNGMLLKSKSVKRSQRQNRRKNKRRKEQRAEKKFKEIAELISPDSSQPIITDGNVVSLTPQRNGKKWGNFWESTF